MWVRIPLLAPMTTDETVDELNIHADTLPRMTNLYDVVFTNEGNYSPELVITLVQTAFWSGVEAAHNDEFRENVKSIIDL